MRVIYQTENDEDLLDSESSFIPRVGDTVLVDEDNQFVVKEVIWNAKTQIALVVVGEPALRKAAATGSDLSGRLNEMQRAIMSTNKRLDATEKKNRSLSEQLVSIRTHVRNQPKPKLKTE